MREIYNSEPNSTSLYLLLLLITAFRRPPEWHLEEPPAPPGHHSIIKQEDQINIQDQQHALASTTMPPGLDSPPVESLQKFQCRANAISCLSPWILTNIVVVMSVLLTFIAFAVNILINCWFIALNHILITPTTHCTELNNICATNGFGSPQTVKRLSQGGGVQSAQVRTNWYGFGLLSSSSSVPRNNWCRFVGDSWARTTRTLATVHWLKYIVHSGYSAPVATYADNILNAPMVYGVLQRAMMDGHHQIYDNFSYGQFAQVVDSLVICCCS